MKHETDADSSDAPDAVDRLLGRSKRVLPLPDPRTSRFPPALGAPSPTVEEPGERVPAAEISLSPRCAYVTIELPGVAKESIEVEATARSLIVRAPRTRGPIYRLTVGLPVPVNPESAKATFRNGILDVTLVRRRGDHDGG